LRESNLWLLSKGEKRELALQMFAAWAAADNALIAYDQFRRD
jgi:hypothetical protein